MQKTGIIGHQNSQIYFESIRNNPQYQFIGIFDPSYQFEFPKNIPESMVFTSFSELLQSTEVLFFAAPDSTYFPLIERAIQYRKAVFLHSTYYLNRNELEILIKLKDEADSILQIQHPFLQHDAYIEYSKLSKTPLLIDCKYCGVNEKNLLFSVRQQVAGILTLFTNGVKKVIAQPIASFSEVPDIIMLRIDFWNGSIANLTINSIEKSEQHTIKLYEYNSYYLIDFSQNKLTCSDSQYDFNNQLSLKNNQSDEILKRQLTEFMHNIKLHLQPKSCIENELNAFLVMEKVKEKMRVCINIF
jgi:hypothetical protein